MVLPDSSPRKVTLQLKWHHQFQFAGYYAALEKGYYAQAGLDVTLSPYSKDTDYLSPILRGQADFGTAGPELLLKYLHGEPVVALAVIMQHSPNVIMTLKSSRINSPHQLVGKRLMLDPDGQPDLWAMLWDEGLQKEKLMLAPVTWDIEELLDGRIDATGAYITNTPYYLLERGIPCTFIRPGTYGVDFYGDCLFTSTEFLNKHPDTVEAFRQASLMGWEYALRHPEEIIELLLTKYDTKKTRDHLRYEAQTIKQLVLPDLVQVGHMNPGRWNAMAQTYVNLGMAKAHYDIARFIYTPGPSSIMERFLWWFFIVMAAALSLSCLLFVFNFRLKRSVRIRVAELSQLNAELSKEIMERRHAEQALRESEETIRAMSNATLDAIIMIGAYGKISFWNDGAESMFGYTATEAMGHAVHELIASEKDSMLAQRAMQRFTLSGQGPIIGQTTDLTAIRKDGSTFPVEVVVASFQHGGQWCAVGSVRDATLRKQTEEKLKLLAITDSLTGAKNRRYFTEHATQEISRAMRYNHPLCLAIFDLDHFKRINDTHGHETGDHALTAFADVVLQEIRTTDLFARIGGEEFVVLLPETTLNDACIVAERIRIQTQRITLAQDKEKMQLSVSAGVAELGATTELEPLMRYADWALYNAKQRGRNRVEAWLPDKDE